MIDFPNIGKRGWRQIAVVAGAAVQVAAAAEMNAPAPGWGAGDIDVGYWRTGPNFMRPVREKPKSEWTDEERAAHERLQAAVAQNWPPDRLEFEDGSESRGWILRQTPDTIVFEERYGADGRMTVTLPRHQVRAMSKSDPPPRVTYRDVEFHLEFPALSFQKALPYTAISDESFSAVREAVEELQRLYREVVRVFGPLISSAARREDIQVLFFSDRAAFEAYRRRYAPEMEDVAGFYNPWLDRLVWFNQRDADALRRARAWVLEQERHYRKRYMERPEVQFQIDEWKREMERRIEAFAHEMTLRTLRHEGAHQLFFSLGVHSRRFLEADWVYEGLAAYAETRPFGARNAERMAVVKEALNTPAWIACSELLRSRDSRGLSVYGDSSRAELAYSEAWAMTAYLMERRRDALFRYLDYVRDERHVAEVEKADAAALLCRFLQLDERELEAEWLAWIRAW